MGEGEARRVDGGGEPGVYELSENLDLCCFECGKAMGILNGTVWQCYPCGLSVDKDVAGIVAYSYWKDSAKHGYRRWWVTVPDGTLPVIGEDEDKA